MTYLQMFEHQILLEERREQEIQRKISICLKKIKYFYNPWVRARFWVCEDKRRVMKTYYFSRSQDAATLSMLQALFKEYPDARLLELY